MAKLENREKVARTLRTMGHRPPWLGGKGRGLTEPQRRLASALGSRWATEFQLLTKGAVLLPYCIYADLANPFEKVWIEVDGPSHGTRKTKESDARRDDWLRSQGWTVLRFTNREVMDHLAGVLQAVASTTSRLTEITTSSRTGS